MRRALLMGLLVVFWLSMASGARAAEVDAFQSLLRHTGLPTALYTVPGEALSPRHPREHHPNG